METIARALLIHPEDNVAVALEDITEGSTVSVGASADARHISARQTIPFGHKIAVSFIPMGEVVVKYGAPVACATAAIEPGMWVHTHNARSQYIRSAERVI